MDIYGSCPIEFSELPIASNLLLFSYVPSIILALWLGVYVLYSDFKSAKSRLFFLICLLFVVWVANIFVQWIATPNNLIFLSWQITPVIEVAIFISAVYFVKAILGYKSGLLFKLFTVALLSIVLILIPTKFNLPFYDYEICEGIPGTLWDALYITEIILIAYIFGLTLKRYRDGGKSESHKGSVVTSIGVGMFLGLFAISNIVGQITGIQEISYIGSLGMIVFLGTALYATSYYKTFKLKLFAAQVSIIFVLTLVGSQILIPGSYIKTITNVSVFIITLIGGLHIVGQVKKEVRQKELLESLNASLSELNEAKSKFISITTHEIATPLTAMKGYISMVRDGTYGKTEDEKEKVIEVMERSTNRMVESVRKLIDKNNDSNV